MRRFIVAGVLLAAVGALSAPGVASAQSTLPPRTEIEPNNSIAQADPVPVLTDTAIRGSIAPAGDRDFFRVVVSQQATVRFETWVPDRPECTLPLRGSDDTVISLFNSTGQFIGRDDDSGTGFCSLLVVTLPPGTYFISVEDFTRQVIPAYTLEIDFTLDHVPCPADDGEDDDGLVDSRERILSTLLGNPDSDRDGISDGNDDANGNGEDDEDEDDDDDCPDEDSDGDGEDDEDEDDEDD